MLSLHLTPHLDPVKSLGIVSKYVYPNLLDWFINPLDSWKPFSELIQE